MNPEGALIELLDRVGAARDGKVYVSDEELCNWPAVAVAAMKSQKLLAKARPAESVVCPGCERACGMPVHTLTRANGTAVSFVVCDKRDDINRVPISTDLLKQWRCDAKAVCDFIAANLDVRRSEQEPANRSLRIIGMARGDKRSQMIALQLNGSLALVAGNNAVPLAQLVGFGDGKYSVDAATVRQLVDAATTVDSRHTPSTARREARKLDTQARYEDWQKEYRKLRRQRPHMSDVWYSRQIARVPIAAGRDAETIRKHMKK